MEQILNIAAGSLLLTATLACYFVIIKPAQNEKALKKEEAERTFAKYSAPGGTAGAEGDYNRLETLNDFE